VSFEGIDEDPASFLSRLTPSFRATPDAAPLTAKDLSDGLRSLFSLSLSLALFAVEQQILKEAVVAGFKAECAEDLPLLTIFAVEEPENHLSPHYLGHVVSQLSKTASHRSAQVVLSSHSPSILARVQPDNVRYFLGNEETDSSSVIPVPLPDNETDEAYKYVREAVRGYPELYFANLVILCEGPSEQIVLKRILEESGTPLDTHFVSLTPLGGRHVNHFWRLLHGLGVKYLTLLDLDREKEGGGWGRLQYVRDQLVQLHGEGSRALEFQENDEDTTLCDEEYDYLLDKEVTEVEEMDEWIDFFQNAHDVFFSRPLDLDLSMLQAFPDVYRSLVVPPRRGPTLPAEVDSKEYDEAIEARVRQVLAENVQKPRPGLGRTYTAEQRRLFPWYKYLFLDGSKPVTHLWAMIAIDSADLLSNMPSTLKDLCARTKELLEPAVPEADDAED